MAQGYAVISVGGKQYRVREGERLLVDRLATDEGKTFSPDVLFLPDGGTAKVTAKVLGHTKGPKIRIGKYRAKTGYKRHTGFRSSLTQIEIESIGGGSRRSAAAKPAPAEKPAAEKPAAAKADDAPKGMPKDYEGMTVAQISEHASGWRRPQLEAALEYEQAHGKRKGAISALDSALAAKEEGN